MVWSRDLCAAVAAALAVLGLIGCNQSPYWGAQRTAIPSAPAYGAQVQDFNRRASALDADNRDLHVELARSNQQVRVLQDEVGLLRDQLQEKATDLRELLAAKQDVDQRVAAIEATSRQRGGATITANSSLENRLQTVELPGLEVRREAGAIHIELPADRLFRPETDQLVEGSQRWFDIAANAIRRSYPQQMIGIEGHTDGAATRPANGHQLAVAQAAAALQALTRTGGLSEKQFFLAGHGGNRPVVSNATPAGRARNRRVEVVIYADTAGDLR